MLSYLNTILAGSISGSHLTQSDIDSKIQTVHSAEDKLALAKEKYRLSQNSKETVYTEQEKEITRLEGLVAQNKESLKSAESRLALIDSQSDQSSQKAKSEEDTVIATESEKIKSIKEQIEVARENVNVVKAAQKRNVDAAKNLLDVANAALSTELSKSGHIEIVSPFTGTVVRRNVAVGDVIGVEKAAFELVEVSSELSEEAQTTIHFGIPEHLAKNILPGTKVEVSLFQGTLSNVWKEAVITRRSEVVDSQTRLVEAQAELVENITLPHNATVRVRLITSDPPIWKVRSSMVKREEGKNFLWVLSSSAHKEPSSEKNDSPQEEVSGATKIPVEVFSEDGEWAHVIGDISETTEILLSPPENFYEYD